MGDGNMEEKKLNRLVVLWLSIIAIICIITSVILEIFAAQKDYFGLLDGLAIGFCSMSSSTTTFWDRVDS